MSERAALMRNVIEHPDDDSARLVMADWFEEHSEPERAEFVRLQVAITQEDIARADNPFPQVITTDKDLLAAEIAQADPARRERLERMRDLYQTHRLAWLADVVKWARPVVQFSRGFVSHVRTTLQRWAFGASALHRDAPVTHVALRKVTGLVGAAALEPRMARVSSLRLSGDGFTRLDGEHFANSRYLGRLRLLGLLNEATSTEHGGLSRILGTAWPDLRELIVTDAEAGVDDLAALTANSSARSLVRLHLASRQITSRGIESLASSPHLNGVIHLTLFAMFGDVGAATLLHATGLESVRHLELWNNGLTADDLRAMVTGRMFARLQSLNLNGNPIGDEGVHLLADTPTAANLRSLNLVSCGVQEDASWVAFAQSPHLANLRRLNIRGNAVTHSTFAALHERFGEGVLAHPRGTS